jgi:hypothetical protein
MSEFDRSEAGSGTGSHITVNGSTPAHLTIPAPNFIVPERRNPVPDASKKRKAKQSNLSFSEVRLSLLLLSPYKTEF